MNRTISVILAVLGIFFLYCPREKGLIKEGKRCVSLVPSITEIIYALGAESLLVGNTNQCDYPEAAKKVYKVGDFQSPDIERIISLRPNVVFATIPIHRPIIEKLKEWNIRVYISDPKDIEGIFAEIESVGTLLDRKERAIELISRMKHQLSSLKRFTDTPKVYIEISSAPLMSVGKNGFINDIIRYAGGRNVFESISNPYPVVDPEMVVKANPDVIIILHPMASAEEIKRRVGWERISAVCNGQVYEGWDEDLFFRPGPRIVQGIILLTHILHKEDIHQ